MTACKRVLSAPLFNITYMICFAFNRLNSSLDSLSFDSFT